MVYKNMIAIVPYNRKIWQSAPAEPEARGRTRVIVVRWLVCLSVYLFVISKSAYLDVIAVRLQHGHNLILMLKFRCRIKAKHHTWLRRNSVTRVLRPKLPIIMYLLFVHMWLWLLARDYIPQYNRLSAIRVLQRAYKTRGHATLNVYCVCIKLLVSQQDMLYLANCALGK